MKILYDDNLEHKVSMWQHLPAGEVYQSDANPSLLAIKGSGEQALCVRAGGDIQLHHIWTPGRESKWHRVGAQLSISAEAL